MSYIDIVEHKNEILCWQRTKEGELEFTRSPLSDYIYCFMKDNSNKGQYKDIFGHPMKKVSFSDKRKLTEFAASRPDIVAESDVKPVYHYILDHFLDTDTNAPYNLAFFDIEVDFDLQDGKGYPSPKNPFGEVNAISVFDVSMQCYVMFIPSHLKDNVSLFDDRDGYDVEIVWCRSERDMLKKWSEYLEHVDILSAWNGCLTPDHKVLTSDLRYVPVGSLEVGDSLLAFDEKVESGKRRHWKKSTVLKNNREMRDVYSITLTNGKTLTSTADHPWFIPNYTSNNKSNGYRYVETKDLKVGMRFQRMIHEWEYVDSYDSGYLSGFFDGEGTLSQHRRTEGSSYGSRLGRGYSLSITASQNPTIVLDEVKEKMEKMGYPVGYYKYDPSNKDIVGIQVKGQVIDRLKFLGETRPKRLIERFNPDLLPSIKNFDMEEEVRIESIEYIGVEEIVELSTSSRTYIAEGYGCHNCNFDIPYIMERLIINFGEKKALTMMTRNGVPARRRDFTNEYKEEVWEWTLPGRIHLDMMLLFKKFHPGEKKSFKLDSICEEVLGEKKIEYEDDLGSLYRQDPQRFFEYSLHDSRLLKMLDDEQKVINLAMLMVWDMCALPKDIFGSIQTIEMGIIKHSRKKGNIVVPDKKEHSKSEQYAGAVVYDSIPGRHEWVMSVDAVSMYPKTMIILGLSPETMMYQCENGYEDYVAIIERDDSWGEICLNGINGFSDETLLPSEIDDVIRSEGFVISANGTIFNGDLGIMAEWVSDNFDMRVEYKKKMKDAFSRGDDTVGEMYNLYQQVRKLVINSCYGAAGNEHFRFYDVRLAQSVTLTAQIISKAQAMYTNEAINMLTGE